MSDPLKILVGTFDTGLVHEFAAGFRELGHQVTTVVCRRPKFPSEITYDVDLTPATRSRVRWPEWIEHSRALPIRAIRESVNRLTHVGVLASLVMKHDIYFFQCGDISLTEHNREYWLLKALGKKLIAAFMGGEARNIDAYKAQYGPASVTPELEADCQRRVGHDQWLQLRAVRLAERYADVVLSQPNQQSLSVRPYRHLFIPLRLANYTATIPGREIPVVVHAPSCRATKGTDLILRAVETLKAEGLRFEFRLVENEPNEIVRRELEQADVLVDQVFFHYHGKLTIEGLASGCAVASANDERHEPFPAGRPIWHIDPSSSLVSRLRTLLTSRHLRLSLARSAAAYVFKFHDHVNVARRLLQCLHETDVRFCEHFPTFYLQDYDPGERIPERLRRLTTEVIRKSGIPAGIDVQQAVARGLLDPLTPGERMKLPRWKPTFS